MTVTSQFVSTCADMIASRIDANALGVARRCLIDGIAAAFTAIGERSIGILLDSVEPSSAVTQGSVIGSRKRVRAEDAALMNGTMISLQLFDDNNEHMRGHPSAPLWPAILATAEAKDKTLPEALEVFVVGFEVECRLGIALNPSHYEVGWHATATQGTIAATVASSMVLGLTTSECVHALGIAASMTGGLRRNFGTMTMSMHSGLAASSGVRAANLAALGFTADQDIFDGAMSFGHVFSREWSSDTFAASFGEWGNPRLISAPGPIFKLFPCGRPALVGLQCAMQIRNEHDLEPNDIKHILCEVSYMYPRTLIHAVPQTGLQGKTSLQYCVAAALLDRRPTLASFTDQAVRREAIASLIGKTEVRVPPELGEHVLEVRKAPFEQPLTITIAMRDGRVFSETVRYLKGSPQNPITDEDLHQKFEDCTTGRLGARGAAAALDYIYDGTATVRGLFELLKT